MYTVTLISRPGSGLDHSLTDALRNAWGGGETRWLAPDTAAEFDIEEIPGNRWDVWKDVQDLQIDLVVQPSDNRRKKLLLADMDSTMIQQECIDELADEAGVGDRVKEITARAMNGELNFESALTERVGLLKGLSLSVIEKVLTERITLMPGGPVLLATMKAHGAYAALVSGGFTAFTQVIADRLGFDEHRANILLSEKGVLTGVPSQPILGQEAKVTALQDITALLGLALTDTLAVGDGANDLGMLHLAGMGVALHAKPSVAAQCDIRINHGDLTSLLYLQGYCQDDFVSP